MPIYETRDICKLFNLLNIADSFYKHFDIVVKLDLLPVSVNLYFELKFDIIDQ